MCGGTARSARRPSTRNGLSPRVRGNPGGGPGGKILVRSIPACAGEPDSPTGAGWRSEVYPRVCGGTAIRITLLCCREGLYPRVRGNLRQLARGLGLARSIPACAGEPARAASSGWRKEVYPRVCGGTRRRQSAPRRGSGLSPRVRGNPGDMGRRPRRARSIPACAGEPSTADPPRIWPPVYPRVCGGTRQQTAFRKSDRGLSPRVRGNLIVDRISRRNTRSIPACAGEPLRIRSEEMAAWVYPRVCGGTSSPAAAQSMERGLSPRVRGNPAGASSRPGRGRSIPACAGEPSQAQKEARRGLVYPRVCGGTAAGRSRA